jgi:hypothetical protein
MNRDSIHMVLVFLSLGLALVSIFLAVRVVLLLQDTSRTLDYLAGQIKNVDAMDNLNSSAMYKPIHVTLCVNASGFSCFREVYVGGVTVLSVISRHYPVVVRSNGSAVKIIGIVGEDCSGEWRVYNGEGKEVEDLLIQIYDDTTLYVKCLGRC